MQCAACLQPESTVAGALSRDVLFTRLGPAQYALSSVIKHSLNNPGGGSSHPSPAHIKQEGDSQCPLGAALVKREQGEGGAVKQEDGAMESAPCSQHASGAPHHGERCRLPLAASMHQENLITVKDVCCTMSIWASAWGLVQEASFDRGLLSYDEVSLTHEEESWPLKLHKVQSPLGYHPKKPEHEKEQHKVI